MVEELNRLLAATPLLANTGGEHLEAISRLSRDVGYTEDELIFHEGEPCGAFFLVVSGLIKLFVTNNRDQQKIIEFISPGETFAEAAMFSGQGYPVSALAVTDSRLIRIDAFGFTRYVHQHPELAWSMLSQLSRRSHYLIGQIRQMSLQGARSQVADYLLQRHSAEEPLKPISGLPTRRADLAAAVGVTVETLCRVISDFRNHGWITTRDSTIIIQDPDRLERFRRDGRPALSRQEPMESAAGRAASTG